MEWQPDNQISKSLFRVIDPAQPLRSDDVFLPSVDFTVMDLLWCCFWFCVFSTGVIAVTYELMGKLMLVSHENDQSGLPSLISILVIVVLCYGVFRTWNALSAQLIRRKMLKNGCYRNGMFILEDAILLHCVSQTFHIEKAFIRDFQIISKGRGETAELQMVLKKNDSAPIKVNLSNLNLELTAFTLKRSLINWKNTGKWVVLPALSDIDMPKLDP